MLFLGSYLVQIVACSRMTFRSISAYSGYLSIFIVGYLVLIFTKKVCAIHFLLVLIEFIKVSVIQGL